MTPPTPQAGGLVPVEAWEGGAAFRVKVRAGARRSEVGGAFDGRLRVSVTTAPEKGKANKAVLALLAGSLGVAVSSLELLSGETDANKRVGVRGVGAEALAARLATLAVKAVEN